MVRIAEKTQIHKIEEKMLALHVMTHTFHAIHILRKCFLFVEFKMFLRYGWTSPYEHLCDTGTSLIPYGEQIKSMYVLLGKKSVLYGSSKSQIYVVLTFIWHSSKNKSIPIHVSIDASILRMTYWTQWTNLLFGNFALSVGFCYYSVSTGVFWHSEL